VEAYLRERLAKLGYELPPVPEPAGSYVPAVRTGDLVFTAGQLPLRHGELPYTGKVGGAVTPEEAREAAALCALNALSAVLSLGDEAYGGIRVVKVVGYVASAQGFSGQPQVLNGASELLGEVLGGAGVHARSAVGVAELPFDAPVEVELVVELSPG
jgi:enamine deaminase RidA (YjgF/YER057c/UK114 family)